MKVGRLHIVLMVGAWVTASTTSLGAQASLSGVVRDSAGRPIANSQVSIDALNRATATDESGHYALSELAAGLRLVRVRRVGFSPTSRMVQLADGASRVADFVLDGLTVLDTMRAKANGVRERLARDINERRKMGFGHFKDSTTLSDHAGMLSVFQDIPSVIAMMRLDPETREKRMRVYLPVPGAYPGCLANLWVDGRLLTNGDKPDHNEWKFLIPSQIGVLEVYTRMSETPAQYIRRGSNLDRCGTIVIWTKQILPL